MKILVANIGSTSFKYRLFETDTMTVIAQGRVERIGQPGQCPDYDTAIGICLSDVGDVNCVAFKAVYAGPLSGARIVEVPVTIRYTGTGTLRPRILIYRVRQGGALRLVKSYNATSRSGRSLWDGTVAGGRPAPRGRYLVAVRVTDLACATGTSPVAPAAAPAGFKLCPDAFAGLLHGVVHLA